jgi:hypothetical protein
MRAIQFCQPTRSNLTALQPGQVPYLRTIPSAALPELLAVDHSSPTDHSDFVPGIQVVTVGDISMFLPCGISMRAIHLPS